MIKSGRVLIAESVIQRVFSRDPAGFVGQPYKILVLLEQADRLCLTCCFLNARPLSLLVDR